jgi:hypothetical protein
VDGFVAGTVQASGFYRGLLKRWRFAIASIVPVLRKPRIIPRFLPVFTTSGQSAASGEGGSAPDVDCGRARVPNVQLIKEGRWLQRFGRRYVGAARFASFSRRTLSAMKLSISLLGAALR